MRISGPSCAVFLAVALVLHIFNVYGLTSKKTSRWSANTLMLCSAKFYFGDISIVKKIGLQKFFACLFFFHSRAVYSVLWFVHKSGQLATYEPLGTTFYAA